MFRVLITLLCLFVAACGEQPTDRPVPTAAERAPDYERIKQQLRDAMSQQDLDRSHELLVELLGPPEPLSRLLHTMQLPEGKETGDTKLVARDAPLLREAFCDTVMQRVIALTDGPSPSGAAKAWLKRLEFMGHPTLVSVDMLERYSGLQKYVGWERLDERHLPLGAHRGPQIVVVCDHFTLGEAVLESMLRRWQREHKARGLRVCVVPLTGRGIRVGMRHVEATPEQEVEAIHARAKELGLTPVDTPWASSGWLEGMGLDPKGNLMLLLDADHRIVARLSGLILDPTAFEETVQRLVTR